VIEEALLRHPAIRGAVAVGRPDRHSGEVSVAYIVPVDAATGSTRRNC
jgi:fatty-acyl-CoA synthase